MNQSLAISTVLFLLCSLARAALRPQLEDDDLGPISEVRSFVDAQPDDPSSSTITRDPLKWIWIDEASLELAWSSKFSLSLGDAVKGYGLSLTLPHHSQPFAATTIYSSTNLQHQFSGLRSNVTYGGKLEALVGPHFWPYNLLNFTFSSAVLMPGVGLGQRSPSDRPASSTADLGSVSVGASLRWSHTPFTTGALTSSEWDAGGGRPEGLRPDGYLLQIWDQKHLILKLVTSVTGKHEGCFASVGGLDLDTAYKATLEGLHADGRVGTSLSFSLDTGGFYVAGGGLTTDGVSDCYSGLQVRCPASERCVSPYWICDGAPDCPDGEDEIGCDKSPCDGFRCWDNVCIPGAWRCDGHRDCKDGDDEYACSGCSDGEMACSTVGFCFYPNVTCDGVPDCPDGWDESLAVCGGKECNSGELPCWDNDHCVQHSRLCDGTPDCPTAEDEDHSFCIAFKSMQETTTLAVDLQASLCDQKKFIKQTNCSKDDYQCESGECIPTMYLCNGYVDCQAKDDEDENACSVYNNISPPKDQIPKNGSNSEISWLTSCGENMVRCPSGKCVVKSEKCLLNDICNDKEMEKACDQDSHSDVENEIESNVIDENSSLELDTMWTDISETDWEMDQEMNYPDNVIHGYAQMTETDNATGSAVAEHNLTAPVLHNLDLESLEDVSQTSYKSSSQEGSVLSGVDISTEMMVEESLESAENETDTAAVSADEESQTEDSEFDDGKDLLIPLFDATSSLNASASGNGFNLDDLSTDESMTNTTVETLIPHFDIFENFNVSIQENEIDEVIINKTTKIPWLDSDEENDMESPFKLSFNSSLDKGIEEGNLPLSLDIERNSSNINHTDEIGAANWQELNFSPESAVEISQDETSIGTTELPASDSTLFVDPTLFEVNAHTTTQSADVDVEPSFSTTATEYSTLLYDMTEKDAPVENTSEESDDSESTKRPNTTEASVSSSDQSFEMKIFEDLFTTDSAVLIQPTTTESPSALDSTNKQILSEDNVGQYQSTTESFRSSSTDTSTNTNNTLMSITPEPENWKDISDGQKNLTILIAVHSIGNKTKIPQYIIHGLDGNTYEYEVVGVDDSNGENETHTNDEDNEIPLIHHEYSGVHELSYLQDSMNSGTRSSFGNLLLLPVITGILVNI